MKKLYVAVFIALPLALLAQALSGVNNNAPAIIAISDSSSSSNTNGVAAPTIVTTEFIPGKRYTNDAAHYATVLCSVILNTGTNVTASGVLQIDQDNAGAVETQVYLAGTVTSTNIIRVEGILTGTVLSGGVFWFTNSAGATMSVESGSSQWAKF